MADPAELVAQAREDLRAEITEVIAEWDRFYPPPSGLAPNLALASRALAALEVALAERDAEFCRGYAAATAAALLAAEAVVDEYNKEVGT